MYRKRTSQGKNPLASRCFYSFTWLVCVFSHGFCLPLVLFRDNLQSVSLCLLGFTFSFASLRFFLVGDCFFILLRAKFQIVFLRLETKSSYAARVTLSTRTFRDWTDESISCRRGVSAMKRREGPTEIIFL